MALFRCPEWYRERTAMRMEMDKKAAPPIPPRPEPKKTDPTFIKGTIDPPTKK